MVKLQDIFINCDCYDKILNQLLDEDSYEEWEELTKIYNNIFCNIRCIKPKDTDYVIVTLERETINFQGYEFFYSSREKAFSLDEEEFKDSFMKIQFNDTNLSTILGMYVCEDIEYCNNIIFLTEIIRKIKKCCSFVKREPKDVYTTYIKYNEDKMFEFLTEKFKLYSEFEKTIESYRPFFIKRAVEKESILYFENEHNLYQINTGENRKYWASFVLYSGFTSALKSLFDVFLIFDKLLMDKYEIIDRIEEYKQILLMNYHKGYAVSTSEKIVIQNMFTEDEKLPMIYVQNNNGVKTELIEYPINRILLMPIEFPGNMSWHNAGAYLMAYMVYPRMYTRYRKNFAMSWLFKIMKEKAGK